MPIQNIIGAPGKHFELHVVANNASTELFRTHILFNLTATTAISASTYLADTSHWSNPADSTTVDVALKFTPLFKGALGTGASANLYSGSGITVNTDTGRIRADPTLPSPRKSNFIIEVTAFNKSTPTVVFSVIIRVHIHQSITKIWVTPPILSLRPFITDNTFGLRAQFDDNTIGDITQMPGVTWSPSSNVGVVSGILTSTAANNVGDLIDITATLMGALGGLTAKGQIRIEKAWDPASPVDISIITGGGSATISKPVNVLLISEGFISGDSAEFTNIVNSLIKFINDPINLPWSKLIPAINFWSVFVPADNRGFSIGSEIHPVLQTIAGVPVIKAEFLPTPIRPAVGSAIWTIEQLIYMVGLPVQSDGMKLPNGNSNPRTNQNILNDWKTVLINDPAPNVNTALINQWRQYSSRSMVDEINSTFGIMAGQPVPGNKATIMEFKNGRMTRDALDHFLGSLNNPATGGVPVNNLWNKTSAIPPNDYDLICFITYGFGRESNQIGYYFVNSTATFPTVTLNPGTNAYSLSMPPASASFITPNKSRVFVHELAHSFFLDDEYAEILGPPVLTSAEIDVFSNVILAGDVLTANQIDVTKIKWNWHRIKSAAILSAAIQPGSASDEFILTVAPGQGSAFTVGDIVHLRFRKYPTPLIANPKLSAPLEVINPAPTGTTINVKVKAGSPFTYSNLVQPADYISTFLADSIVYKPVDAPASVKSPTYPYAEMIAKNIKDYIGAHNVPLTGPIPATPTLDKNNPQPPIFNPALSFPTSFKSTNLPRIAGLYAGGHTFQLGLFHATGNCIMRKSQDPPVPDTLGREFCAVCRYVLVDTIDPAVHGDIDALYSQFYPQV